MDHHLPNRSALLVCFIGTFLQVQILVLYLLICVFSFGRCLKIFSGKKKFLPVSACVFFLFVEMGNVFTVTHLKKKSDLYGVRLMEVS